MLQEAVLRRLKRRHNSRHPAEQGLPLAGSGRNAILGSRYGEERRLFPRSSPSAVMPQRFYQVQSRVAYVTSNCQSHEKSD